MSTSSIENRMTEFLKRKGYHVEIEPSYPSTIDILATKGDNLILVEVKLTERIDASDVARLKSYEEFLRSRKKAKKRLTSSFLISQGTATGSAQELSREFEINILKPNQIHQFYSHKIFKEK